LFYFYLCVNEQNKQTINQSINQSLPPQLPLEHQLITETKWLSNEQIVGFLKTTATTTTKKQMNSYYFVELYNSIEPANKKRCLNFIAIL